MKSMTQRVKQTGELEGIYFTSRDIDFIKFTTRWWCVSADHYLRKVHSESTWSPVYVEGENGRWREKNKYNVTRRMSKLANLDQYSPLTVARGQNRDTAFWATHWGGELIGSNFNKYMAGNIQRTAHAWAACDIGMSFERAGIQVYSEREFANGWTINNEEVIGGKFSNPNPNSKSTNPDHGARPDLAIPGQNGNFIFIEVEHDSGQGYDKYKKKLASYYASERVSAVWYVVDSEAIGKRIARVHEDMQDSHREMPIRLFQMMSGYHNYKYIRGKGIHGSGAQEDLKTISAMEVA